MYTKISEEELEHLCNNHPEKVIVSYIDVGDLYMDSLKEHYSILGYEQHSIKRSYYYVLNILYENYGGNYVEIGLINENKFEKLIVAIE